MTANDGQNVPSYIHQPFLRPELNPPEPGSDREKMLAGELYCAFVPRLIWERNRSIEACERFNNKGMVSRRKQVEMWRDIVQDPTPLPAEAPTPEEDDALFALEPWVETPFRADYGQHVTLGQNVYINFNCVMLDTCRISIGARTLVGPDVKFFSGTHPLDPALRNGTQGPELGKEIIVEEDVWIGGCVCILPGVTVGKGATIGAGSVVTKNVAPFTVVAGNPAKFIRKVESAWEDKSKAP